MAADSVLQPRNPRRSAFCSPRFAASAKAEQSLEAVNLSFELSYEINGLGIFSSDSQAVDKIRHDIKE
jgi:hypothetical protein